jgi:hypothetical protein
MADVSFKVDRGPKGGYLAYIAITSPVLGKNSGKWHLVVPEDHQGEANYEYPFIISAENAAKKRAFKLLERVELMELAAGITKRPSFDTKGKLKKPGKFDKNELLESPKKK